MGVFPSPPLIFHVCVAENMSIPYILLTNRQRDLCCDGTTIKAGPSLTPADGSFQSFHLSRIDMGGRVLHPT